MAKQKHLTLEERFRISKLLDSNYSYKTIGKEHFATLEEKISNRNSAQSTQNHFMSVIVATS